MLCPLTAPAKFDVFRKRILFATLAAPFTELLRQLVQPADGAVHPVAVFRALWGCTRSWAGLTEQDDGLGNLGASS